jgi:hypothetical protein
MKNEVVQTLCKRFPQHDGLIHHLILNDSEFCSLCEDYSLCIQTLEEWCCSGESMVQERVEEYTALLEELEQEILELLEKCSPTPEEKEELKKFRRFTF